MKQELTPELKAKFIAQYWGQKVLLQWFLADGHVIGEVNPHALRPDLVHPKDMLALRPLSSISDEDAKWFADKYEIAITGVSSYLTSVWWVDSFRASEAIEDYQFLISKGYTLPFMGHSVEELVEAGWIKLIQG